MDTIQKITKKTVEYKVRQLIEEAKIQINKKLEDSFEEIVASVMIDTEIHTDVMGRGNHFHVHITKR